MYEECDGLEYELSATRLDLRFVAPDITFSSPESSCLHPPDPEKYQPKQFFTTALQQGKVELTWDEENQDKLKSMKEAFDRVDNDDFGDMSNLIGSASESEEEPEGENSEDGTDQEDDDKDKISQYKALLLGVTEVNEKEDEEGNMEVTWNEEAVEEDEEEEASLTPWEKFLQKKKEKKLKRKNQKRTERGDDSEDDIPDDVDLSDPFFAEELGQDFDKKKDSKNKKKKKTKKTTDELNDDAGKGNLGLMVMDSDDEKEHFDFKHILEAENKEGKKKKKWKKKKKELDIPIQDNFSVDVADTRFSAVYSRPEFNIDPTDPNFKKTKNMEKIIGEKQKRFKRSQPVEERGLGRSKKQKLDPEVSQAIKSVKNKWKKNSMKSRKLSFKVTDS